MHGTRTEGCRRAGRCIPLHFRTLNTRYRFSSANTVVFECCCYLYESRAHVFYLFTCIAASLSAERVTCSAVIDGSDDSRQLQRLRRLTRRIDRSPSSRRLRRWQAASPYIKSCARARHPPISGCHNECLVITDRLVKSLLYDLVYNWFLPPCGCC